MQLKLDRAGDLAIENEKFVFITGSEEIQQLITSRINTFLGEYFLNSDIGVPYFQVIFEKGVNPTIIYNIFVEVITTTDGVLELTKLDIDVDYELRTGSVDIEVRVSDGLVNFTLPIGVK